MFNHLTIEELESGLAVIRESPKDSGILEKLVIRPLEDRRRTLSDAEVSPEGGVHGDAWANGCWKSLPDGRPDPDVQFTIMNTRAIRLMAQSESRWSLAGDQFFADLDLSRDNLPCGQRLSVGSAELRITDVPHNACAKFTERFGADAVKFANSEAGKKLRLRGVYATVIQAGVVRVGDRLKKL
jgi:hypothetical protein